MASGVERCAYLLRNLRVPSVRKHAGRSTQHNRPPRLVAYIPSRFERPIQRAEARQLDQESGYLDSRLANVIEPILKRTRAIRLCRACPALYLENAERLIERAHRLSDLPQLHVGDADSD